MAWLKFPNSGSKDLMHDKPTPQNREKHRFTKLSHGLMLLGMTVAPVNIGQQR
jgi:hypothetical protein